MNTKPTMAIGAVLSAFFIQGFCDIVGISSDYARDAFNWSQTMTGFLPTMVFVWFLFFSIPIGIKMNKWGRKNTVLLGMVVTVVGMLVPLLNTSWACLAGYAALGIGNAILQVSSNSLVRNVVSSDRLLTSSLTAGQVVKAVSSFCGPFIMVLAVNVIGRGNAAYWHLAFPIMGLLTFLSALWLWMAPIEREPRTLTDVTVGKTLQLLKSPTILLLFLGIFFVVATDVGTNFVSSKIMIQRYGWSNAEAGMAPQVYFICRTVGAFLGVFLMTKIASIAYFRYNIVACIVVVVLLAFAQMSPAFSLGLIGAIGFLCSCIFPIIYAQAVQARPDDANLISGLMITAVAGGGAATPFIGWATDSFGTITAGVCVLLFCTGYLAFCAFFVSSSTSAQR